MKKNYDLAVIGGGPAGYVAAIRGAQMGMKTVLFEKEQLGGTCLNVGCIPTKAMFQSAEAIREVQNASAYGVDCELKAIDFSAVMKRKEQVVAQLVGGVSQLLRKNKVDVVAGEVKFHSAKQLVDTKTGDLYEGKNILICTGSVNMAPPIPGLDGKNVGGSTELLAMEQLPESIVIVGGGVIGCEFANILNAFGCQVTVVEMLPAILANMESMCGELIEAEFKKAGIAVMKETKVLAIKDDGKGRKEVTCRQSDKEMKLKAEYVLIAAGRKAASEGLNAEAAGIKTEKGFIQVNDFMETSAAGVYAAGDITGRSFLAHAASEAGVIAVENMAGAGRKMNFNGIPKVVFAEPEVSSVGLSEEEARSAGYDVVCGAFPLAGNGKSLAMGKSKGFVKVVAEKKNQEILGIHMAGAGASELVTVGASLIAVEAVLEDAANTVYPHPAVAESIREACLDAMGRSIHK
jgi:dihydrolipoamide dehydrogenase